MPVPVAPSPTPTMMSVSEMRALHQSALSLASAKRTELRLVLASRYRELVGSSEEVLLMRDRAEELMAQVEKLPGLVANLAHGQNAQSAQQSAQTDEPQQELLLLRLRHQLSSLPRQIHAHLDSHDVHSAASDLGQLFHILATHASLESTCRSNHGHLFLLAKALSINRNQQYNHTDNNQKHGHLSTHNNKHTNADASSVSIQHHPLLQAQMKMIYLHFQTMPHRILQLARKELLRSTTTAHYIAQTLADTAPSNKIIDASDWANKGGAYRAAAALSALDLMNLDTDKAAISETTSTDSRSSNLIDLYYDCKSQLINSLLNQLTLPSTTANSSSSYSSSYHSTLPATAVIDATSVTNAAESILSKIVLILQYDVILYPYMIFVLRKFPIVNGGSTVSVAATVDNPTSEIDHHQRTKKEANSQLPQQPLHQHYVEIQKIMSTLPSFDPDVLKAKASRFLAVHLPLIRTKVKSVLVIIAGTTASKLGQIRQSLYDKTDGVQAMTALDGTGICSWDEAVGGIVDVRVVSHGTAFGNTAESAEAMETKRSGRMDSDEPLRATTRRFSLWGALFSNTFSSLVHSLLTTSFHSVHLRVVSTLRASLARAPPFEAMLPHEAHRNALHIATDLDDMLRKVSDDAHELLVHAEEREESERRLRQSLYVQTCEIMGRLLNELRRILIVRKVVSEKREEEEGVEDATRELIVGRLCYLLKFRLKSLPVLLDPKSSPAILAAGFGGGKSTGMITRMELSSSFDLADDDEDGLISFDEAMEAMESAFSGTHFHGAEMVRDTLLLSQSSAVSSTAVGSNASLSTANSCHSSFNPSNTLAPLNVTLSELVLLSARGLRHDTSGAESALGTVQSSLDDIVQRCFKEWARSALSSSLYSFTNMLHERIEVAYSVSDMEWRRLHGLMEEEEDRNMKGNDCKDNLNERKEMHALALGQVSPHVISYLLAVVVVLNKSVCPVDSLPPVPSMEYAQTLGVSLSTKERIPTMMITIRGLLMKEALTSLSKSLFHEIRSLTVDATDTETDNKFERFSPSSLIQLLMDVMFIKRCFFERNRHGFFNPFAKEESFQDSVENSRKNLESISNQLSNRVKLDIADDSQLHSAIAERHSQVFASCDLFLSSLFGENDAEVQPTLTSQTTETNGVGQSSLYTPLSAPSITLNPLLSSRRFVLLPIQAEKSLNEVQLRGKYGKKVQEEKSSIGSSTTSTSGNALGSGFGFLSSMLSTKTR